MTDKIYFLHFIMEIRMIVILIKLFKNYSLNFSYFVRNSDIKKASKLENIEGNIVVTSQANFKYSSHH